MNYLEFKRRALVTQIFNILFIESNITNDLSVTVTALSVDAVPFVAVIAAQAQLEATIQAFTALSFEVVSTETFDVEAVMAVLESLSMGITIADDIIVSIVAESLGAQLGSTIIPLTFTVESNALVTQAITVQTDVDIGHSINVSMINGTLLSVSEISIVLELLTSVVATLAATLVFDLEITMIDSVDISMSANEASFITVEITGDADMASLFTTCYIKSIDTTITNQAVLSCEATIAEDAYIYDYETLTLDEVGGWTIDRFTIKF